MISASPQRDAQAGRQTWPQVSHPSPPALLAHAGQGSNPKLCILTPEATLWPQHNFQLWELTQAKQGRTGNSAFNLWFFCQSSVCSFSSCCSSPPFCCLFPSLFLTDKGHHPGPKVLQIQALCDPVPPLPALQDMQSVPFVTHVQGEKGNLTYRKARDLWHLWSVFQQCNSHCINYTQTVLSARLLIAVNIMN